MTFKLILFIFCFYNCGIIDAQTCDILILTNGTEIESKVEEIRINEIAYRKCDNPLGPLYVIEKEKIFMIKYKNGTKEVISQVIETSKEDPVSQKNISNKKEHSFLDFSMSIGNSGFSGADNNNYGTYGYYSDSFISTSKSFGVSLRFGNKWMLNEISTFYQLGLQTNWIRLRAGLSKETKSYSQGNINYHQNRVLDITFLNLGIVNRFKIGSNYGIQVNINFGPNYFARDGGGYDSGFGLIINPEIKFEFKKLYLCYDYSTSLINIYRQNNFNNPFIINNKFQHVSNISIGVNF